MKTGKISDMDEQMRAPKKQYHINFGNIVDEMVNSQSQEICCGMVCYREK